MALALPLLDRIAPDVAPPVAFRPGGRPPRIERVAPDDLVGAALRVALELAREDGLLAVILPEPLVPHVAAASAYEDGIPLLSPRGAKGLEFDHAVVVEPAAIAEGERGLRELYVALTPRDDHARRRPRAAAAGGAARAARGVTGTAGKPMGREGFEPSTLGLRVPCSTN